MKLYIDKNGIDKHHNRFCIGKNRIDCVKKQPEPLKHLNKLYIGKNMIDGIKKPPEPLKHQNRPMEIARASETPGESLQTIKKMCVK